MKQNPAYFDAHFEAAHTMFKKKITTFSRNAVHSLPGMDIEDIEQELCIVLARVVRDYDPDKGASFNTVAQQSFQNRIRDLIRMVSTKSRTAIMVYLDEDDTTNVIQAYLATASTEEEVIAREMINAIDPDVLRVALEMSPAEKKAAAKRHLKVA
jgi:DNA-directed RNA polymerase specialized sigma subunit